LFYLYFLNITYYSIIATLLGLLKLVVLTIIRN
jgi:hypothetical protein